MHDRLRVCAAANTLAPALAELGKLGFAVTLSSPSGGAGLKAERGGVVLEADDTLQLLGLVCLLERRGSAWMPTESEVEALLALQGTS